MLYKVFSEKSWADYTDQLGVVAADNIQQAVQRLTETFRDHWDWGGYKLEGEPGIQYGRQTDKEYAIVAYTSGDSQGTEGQDIYIIWPVPSDVFLWLQDDLEVFFEPIGNPKGGG